MDDKAYEVPIFNSSFKQDMYYVRKAIKGDEDARDLLLGGKEERAIFIGDGETIRWLYITKDDEFVKEIKHAS